MDKIPLIQNHTFTSFNRYPKEWKKIPSSIKPERILVFGCSTGEEVVTAQAHYPESEVYGYDINKTCLKIARIRFPFLNFLDELDARQYNMIVCNSVLCHHPENVNAKTNEAMTFEQFQEIIKVIDSKLIEGGILMAVQCEYLVSDATNYQHIGSKASVEIAIFNKRGEKMRLSQQHTIWVKPVKL